MMRLLQNGLFMLCLLGWPLLAGAHEVEVCLAKVEQTSGLLQTCRVSQTAAGQCDALAQRLERFQAECRQLQHPAEYIERATAAGAAGVEGQPQQSPYQQRLARERREQSLVDANLQRFATVFAGFEMFAASLNTHFATSACPHAYEGMRGQWLHAGHISLQRYDLAGDGQTPAVPVQFHFFAPAVAGRCYPVPPPGYSGSVINIPGQMVDALAQQGRAARCESTDCTATREQINALYRQYQSAFREYRQLMVCADAAEREASVLKRMTGTAAALPDYCPPSEIDVAYLNAQGLVKELDQRLFGLAR